MKKDAKTAELQKCVLVITDLAHVRWKKNGDKKKERKKASVKPRLAKWRKGSAKKNF